MAEAQLTNQLSRIDSMTNVELRAELKRRGYPTSGNKKDLIAKLRVALQKEYEQIPAEAPTHFDGRHHHLAGLQQSPGTSLDMGRPSLDNSAASSNSYMTPHSGSPIVYSERAQGSEGPFSYANVQMHDQSAGQYGQMYNMNMAANIHQSPGPMIPVPQHITMSSSERPEMYEQSYAQNQQTFSPMHTRQQQANIDNSMSTLTPPVPERRTRARSKKNSVDSQPIEVQQQTPVLTVPPPQTVHSIPMQQTVVVEQPVIDSSANNKTENNIEVNPVVSKSIEEEQKYREDKRGDREDSRSPSVGSSSAKSESVIKEIPLSGERHRLSRSKSPKSRWHHSPSPQQQTNQTSTIDEEQSSATPSTNDDVQANSEQVEKSPSTATSTADEIQTADVHDQKQQQPSEVESQETVTKNQPSPDESQQQQPEKAAPQQQLKPSRSQTPSASLMKGLNRATTSNRVNLSSDVLKTLIPSISLAPESVITDELEASINDEDEVANAEHEPTQPALETSAGSAVRLSDSMTVGELAEQKQQRNRTVVIDLAVDSSSLNDDLVNNNSDNRKKASTTTPPMRMPSFESKTLLDGKTNALMMDEPVRVKDAAEPAEPPSRILYICGLTRPFALPLLKELLTRYGKLVDGEFWLDKIKSQCFVTYTTIEAAQSAREGLDGCRWPPTSPKILSVRFGRQEEFEFSKENNLPPDQMLINAMDTSNSRLVQEKPIPVNKAPTSARRSASPAEESKPIKKPRPAGTTDVREWDLPKLQPKEEKEKSPVQRIVTEEEKAAKPTEPPSKGLDDYFRKTKAKPAIYWLPLTEEQIAERIRRQQQRTAERDEEQRKRELEENARSSTNNKDSKSRSNNDNRSSNRTSRRSASPKEKRRRVSSSASPRARDNKRH